MTAMPSGRDGGRSLGPGAQPAAIADALFPEDRAEFMRSYEREMVAAQESYDLTALLRTLEQWRGLAAMQARPEQYREDMRRAAEIITGEPSPEDEDLKVTRAKVGA